MISAKFIMLNFFLVTAFLGSSFVSSTRAQDPGSQPWKTFTSDYGYEFKYPECWIVKGDRPHDHSVENPSSRDISIDELDSCKRPRMSTSVPNGISASADPVSLNSKEIGLKTVETIEKYVANNIASGAWKAYKRFNANGTGIGYFYVENETNKFHPYIRWQLTLFCKRRKLRFQGPMIDRPDKSFDEKFKAGNLALPEPEKTIYESIRCVDPKTKT